jgi:hypothetical protein
MNSGIQTFHNDRGQPFSQTMFSSHAVSPPEAAALSGSPSPLRNPIYPSENTGVSPYYPRNNILSSDPRTWTATDVCYWLQWNNIPENIIHRFKNEQITGETLFLLSKEDLSVIGVQTLGQKLMIAKLIEDLKVKWLVTADGMGSGIGHVAYGRSGHIKVAMEDGKGAPITDAPPLYQF